MPESITNWDEESKDELQFDEWVKHVKEAKWDKDNFVLNYVLHPYWGAAYHVRARERGYGRRGAFWYSVLLSTLYEYGLESVFEHPSQQDIFVTPVIGSWLGGHFTKWRDATYERTALSGETRFRDRALLAMTDPLGATNSWIDRKLGVDSVSVTPFVQKRGLGYGVNGDEKTQRVFGIHVRMKL